MLAAMVLLGACAEADEQQKAQGGKAVTIQLTASVATETLSPGDATAWSREAWKELTSRRATRGLYETAIANGEKVYVWADKGTAGTYAFLKAWTLTSDGSGGLTGSTKYYPSDGDGLTFRAVHGNFSTAPTEGTAIGTLTHTVLADQSATGNYEKSDLMYGEGTGSWESAGIVNFIHKLSKIEVNLTAGIGLIPSDVTNVTVKVRNVKPSITINPSTGALGSASGTATTITARHTGNGVFEAVIPPQAAPSGVLTITMGNVTVTVPNTVTTFAENAKYIYNVKCDNKDKHLNPLWYVAENNVKSYNSSTKVVTLETNPAAAGSAYCYSWSDAIAYFANYGSSYDSYWGGDITDGTTGFKYHIPVQKEWFSVLPSNANVFNNISSSYQPSGGLVSSAQTCIFGYNDETKTGVDDWSYWSTYTASSKVRYALRYLGTPYCSAWKYELSGSVLTVTAKLIDYLDKNDASLGTKFAAYMNDASFWTTLNEDEGALKRQFYAVGYRNNSSNGGTGTADYDIGTYGHYWTATETSFESARQLYFHSGGLHVHIMDKKWGCSIRLFRNEGLAEARVRPKLPIEYIAPYNMQTATSMATDNLKSHSMYFCWNTSKAGSNGVGTPSDWSKAKANIQAMIKGTAVAGYHLPSKAEWCSVVAPYNGSSQDSDIGGGDGVRIKYKNGQHTGLTERVAWGVTNNNGTYTYDVDQVFYNDYNCPNDAAHTYIGYGLRFKPTASTYGQYTCAYRYEYKSADASVGGGASLTIQVKYVGTNTSITISTISNESWWTSPDFTVVLPACGYSPYSNGSDQAPGWSSATSPANGYYWSATARDASYVRDMDFNQSAVDGSDWREPGRGFSVRLFKDR